MKNNEEIGYVKIFAGGKWQNLMHGNIIDIDNFFTNCANKLDAIRVIRNIFKINTPINDISLITFERFDDANKGKEIPLEMLFSDKRYLYEMASELTSKKEKICEEAINFFSKLVHRIAENHNRSYFTNMKKNPLKDQLLSLKPNIKDNVLVKEKMKKILLDDYLIMRSYVLTYDNNAVVESYKLVKNIYYSYNQNDAKFAFDKLTLNIKIYEDSNIHKYPELEALAKASKKREVSLDEYLDRIYGPNTSTRSDMQIIYACGDDDEDTKMR